MTEPRIPPTSSSVAATEELVDGLASMLPTPVDELHVAATLESHGVTDHIAHARYGSPDVFALAAVLLPRLPRAVGEVERRTIPSATGRAFRTLAHGPLYVLPSAVYPSVFMALGATAMVRGMIFATALGWVWGMGMSAVAYQLVGCRRAQTAAWMLRFLSAAGLVVALAGATLIASVGTGGPGLILFVVAQMGFQLGSSVLLFYRREIWVATLMLPACAVGLLQIMTGYAPELIGPTAAAGVLSVVLILAAAWLAGNGAADVARERPLHWWPTVQGALPSMAYAVLCAVFLLFTDGRFVVGDFDLAIAVAPLVLGMGAVEWCALRFTEKATDLLYADINPAAFGREVRRLLWRQLTLCLLVLAGLGLALLQLLGTFGPLSADTAMLVEAHVLLGATYFVGFVLARHEQFRRLLVTVASVVTLHVVTTAMLAAYLGPYVYITTFLVSAGVLLIVLLIVLNKSIAHVYHYR